MLAEKAENPPMTQVEHRASFFRQSGWLMVANIAGGALMFAVHFLAKKTGESQYGLFVTLLTVVMLVPAIPLQMVFAQQTAKAVAMGREAELAGMIRLICFGLLVLWSCAAGAVLILQSTILKFWGVSVAGLWITMPTLLFTLWSPVFMGMLQGEQNFFWLAWSMLSGGVGRLAVAALAVLVLHSGAVGMMAGVLIGTIAPLVIAIWQTRHLWRLAPQGFDWASVLRQVIPLLFGFLFVQFLFTGDTLFVKHYFTPGQTGGYGAAGTLSRALIWLVGPLATVMFPRIVHSSVKSQQTNIMGVVLIGTAILAIGGAAGLTILGPWVVRLVYGASFVQIAGSVLPWYAGAMVPLALANVLVNNLLARSRFAVVPFILLLGVGYAATMVHVNQVSNSLVAVLQTLGSFNLLLLVVCAWFTWGPKRTQAGLVPDL